MFNTINYDQNFDYQLAFHCAPTFAGIKASNLISVNRNNFKDLSVLLEKYNDTLASSGFKLKKICECRYSELILVYNPEALFDYLCLPEITSFMTSQGYDFKIQTLDEMLELFSQKLTEHQKFQGPYPHEIGILLNYPVGDVDGFVKNNGSNYLISGYWKVYTDVESTKHLFKLYDTVREQFVSDLIGGSCIVDCIYKNNCQNDWRLL